MNQRSLTVLIVDDEPAIRLVLAAILRHLECNSIAAVDGLEAVALAKDHPFDLAIVDLQMPSIDGRETCKLLSQVRPQAQLVMSSAVTDWGPVGLPEGCWVLPKPYGMTEVEEIIQRAAGTGAVRPSSSSAPISTLPIAAPLSFARARFDRAASRTGAGSRLLSESAATA